MDYPKAGMHTPVFGQMYCLGTMVHENKSENVELQRKEMVLGFLDCDDTEYNWILDTLIAGIYFRATGHSIEMMRTGSTSSRDVIGLVHGIIVDSDSDSKIAPYPENCGA